VIAFAPIPMEMFQMWYCPFPIATWLTTRSVSGLLLMVLIFVVASAIWYPFFKAYEKQEMEKEAEAAKKA
jgi:PTS system cellobiose-specific IIC component